MTTTRRHRGRPITVAAAGLPLVLFPSRVGTLAAGGGTVPDARIIRLLGARTVGQGAVLFLRPTTTTWRLAAAVDVAHGASMVGLAAVSRRYRRPALISALIAAASAGLELVSGEQHP